MTASNSREPTRPGGHLDNCTPEAVEKLLAVRPGPNRSRPEIVRGKDDGSIIIVVATGSPLNLTGVNGRRIIALPHDRLQELLKKYNRLVEH